MFLCIMKVMPFRYTEHGHRQRHIVLEMEGGPEESKLCRLCRLLRLVKVCKLEDKSAAT